MADEIKYYTNLVEGLKQGAKIRRSSLTEDQIQKLKDMNLDIDFDNCWAKE